MQDSVPFVSYSANREDVLLHRLFRGRERGFYVDVGAAHPTYENDTKALYDRGWRGINVEPNAAFFRDLAAERTRDLNLNIVVSDTPGMATFHEVVGTGLSTLEEQSLRHALERGFEVRRHEVQARPLREILEDAPRRIDFLKVDVEGAEMKVLSSNDWDRFRPDVIMVEATFPETPVRRPDEVTPFLAQHGYRRAYFDGLNDWYVEQSASLPEDAFTVPLNIFDNILPHGEKMLANARDSLAAEVKALKDVIAMKDAEAEAREAEAKTREAEARTREAEAAAHIAKAHDLLRKAYADLTMVNAAAQAANVDLERANREIVTLRADLARQVESKSREALVAAAEIAALRGSTSWRVTRPLRAIKRPRSTLAFLFRGGPR